MHAYFKRPKPTPEAASSRDQSPMSMTGSGDGANSSVRERFQAVFGDYWLLNFLFPQVWFPNRLTAHYRQTLIDAYTKEM